MRYWWNRQTEKMTQVTKVTLAVNLAVKLFVLCEICSPSRYDNFHLFHSAIRHFLHVRRSHAYKLLQWRRLMAIDVGERTSRFLPQRWRYRPVTRYRLRVGPSVHEYVVHFHRSTSFRAIRRRRLCSTSKLFSFCVQI